MGRKRKEKPNYKSTKDMPIDEFDCFVNCVIGITRKIAPFTSSDEMEQFYVNRITRDFHFVYCGMKDYAFNDELIWRYDSDKKHPKWAKISRNYGENAWNIVIRYKFYAFYKLLCLYFFNDESLLEELYKRAKKNVDAAEKYYKDKSDEERFNEKYNKPYSYADEMEDQIKTALGVRSGEGRLHFSPLYKIQEKKLGIFPSKTKGYWIERIDRKIKVTGNCVLQSVFYDCMGESWYRASKAIKEIDAKINAFLKRKEEERNVQRAEKARD